MNDSRPLTIELNGPQWLTLHQEFPDISPEALLRWFLEPHLLNRWWPQEASVEPRVGGCWQMRWPSMGWVLDGQIAGLTGTMLLTSWVWRHEPEIPARVLFVNTVTTDTGTLLTLRQGPYRQGDAFPHEDADRTSHLEGWEHFLPRLVAATSPSGR